MRQEVRREQIRERETSSWKEICLWASIAAVCLLLESYLMTEYLKMVIRSA